MSCHYQHIKNKGESSIPPVSNIGHQNGISGASIPPSLADKDKNDEATSCSPATPAKNEEKIKSSHLFKNVNGLFSQVTIIEMFKIVLEMIRHFFNTMQLLWFQMLLENITFKKSLILFLCICIRH